MTTASPAPLRDPQQALQGWVSLVERLVQGFGVEIKYAALSGRGGSEWDSVTRTLVLRADATIGQQAWLMGELWRYLTFGPEASPTAERLPLLQVVPQPRSAPDEQSA